MSVKESKYYSDVMKSHFNKELVRTKENVVDFENPTKCWICDNAYVDGDVKVSGSAYRVCNIKVKSQNFCRISQPRKL